MSRTGRPNRLPRGHGALTVSVLLIGSFFLTCQPSTPQLSDLASADEDGDGVADISDLCADTEAGRAVDAGGCELRRPSIISQLDSLPGFIDTAAAGVGPPKGTLSASLPSVTDSAAPAGFVQVEVMYGTDREATGALEPVDFFGYALGELQLGSAIVHVPLRHILGEGTSWDASCFGLGEGAIRDFALAHLQPLDEATWLARFRAYLEDADQGDALVVIHGFNVTFDQAVRRTAQLALDLSFQGVPVAYSWPSRGRVTSYAVDAEMAELAVPNLARFLRLVVEETGAERVHVIAHSMGNRVLTGALRSLRVEDGDPFFDQVILAAPDINALLFQRRIEPAIRGSADRITVYASSNDRALQAAMEITSFARVGQSGDDIVVLEHLDTVDASNAATDLLGHGYFAENKRVIDDIFLLVRHELPPAERRLERRPKGDLAYWVMP